MGLWHHGIHGQKWRIRRFQNEDGSLTAAGRVRYNVGEPNEAHGKNLSFRQTFTVGAVSPGYYAEEKEKPYRGETYRQAFSRDKENREERWRDIFAASLTGKNEMTYSRLTDEKTRRRARECAHFMVKKSFQNYPLRYLKGEPVARGTVFVRSFFGNDRYSLRRRR